MQVNESYTIMRNFLQLIRFNEILGAKNKFIFVTNLPIDLKFRMIILIIIMHPV